METSDKNILLILGKVLRILRESKNVTQENLAYEAGFTRSYYTEIETGKRNISIQNLYRISIALDVPLSVIFEKIENGI